MNRARSEPSRRRRPYLGLLALGVAMMIWPSTGAAIALISGAIVVTVLRAAVAGVRGPKCAESDAGRADAVQLGVDRGGDLVTLTDEQLSAHGLVLGASGAGKSTTLLTILADRIARGRSVVVLDMKGSPAFAADLERAAGAAGRPFRQWTLDGPSQWNPLAHGNATELKDRLISTERFTEPHYQRAAERYLQTAISVLLELRPERPPTLDDVVNLMEPRALSTLLRNVRSPRADRVLEYLSTMSPDQQSAVRGLGTRLAIISESHSGTRAPTESSRPRSERLLSRT
jgi:hypothetical protein